MKLDALSFVALDGAPPEGVELDRIPAASAVFERIRAAVAPFLAEGAVVTTVAGRDALPAVEGLHLIYAYGHAWRADGDTWIARPVGDGTVVERGGRLLAKLLDPERRASNVLIVDTCHAATFADLIPPGAEPRLAVFGSGADESALALTGDRASRLSVAMSEALRRAGRTADLTAVALEAGRRLDADGIVQGQTVSYRMHGSPVLLDRSAASGKADRARAATRIRNLFVGAGAAFALAVVVAGWFYRTHAMLEVDVSGLASIASHVRVVATQETPADNGSRTVETAAVSGARIRFWAPASDLVVRVQASFRDGGERRLDFPLLLRPGFSPGGKWLYLALPSAADIAAHPGMAYVAATLWTKGADRRPVPGGAPFWIDIRPPTVKSFLPIAERLVASGRLPAENSALVQQTRRSAAIDAVGLEQLRTINDALRQAVGRIDQSSSQQVSAPGDLAIGLGPAPCALCPAPMTHVEAATYCSSLGKSLPTDDQWELAARGVDGRVYPWGNRFDADRANVPGLPQKGEPSPSLKPVDAYPGERSPFGLVDTVGNAGDWVAGEPGSNWTYMGATFRFNPEDATVFRELPVTEDYSTTVQWITARCASPAGGKAPRSNR